MPRRAHHLRLQRMERALGLCECRKALVLTCLKRIEAHERGEVEPVAPCPAGCPPEARLVVAMRLSTWRNGDECACQVCDPDRQRRPLVPEPVAPRLALPAKAGGGAHPQQPPEPAGAPAAGEDASEPQPEALHAQEPAAGVPAGREEAMRRLQAEYEAGHWEATLEPPAGDAVIEVWRAPVSVPVGGPTPQLGPEDVVGGPDPHGPCAIPWCLHPLRAHRSYTERLPCRYCGWSVTDHDGTETQLPYASRRLWPCGTYLAINFEGGEQDRCAVAGCACPGWRRTAPYVSERELAIRAQIARRDAIIARNEETLAQLQAECERLQREALRAQGLNDNGPAPRGCPVFIEGASK